MIAKRDVILRGSCFCEKLNPCTDILLSKTTAARNEDALSYHSVRGQYLLAVVFAAAIVIVDNIFKFHDRSCLLVTPFFLTIIFVTTAEVTFRFNSVI